MKKRYWVMLGCAYAAAMIGYFVYENAESRRAAEEIVLYTREMPATSGTTNSAVTAGTTVSATTSAVSSASTASMTTTLMTTAQTAASSSATAATATTTAVSVTESTTTAETSTTTTTTTTTATTVSYPIDLNTATLEQLCTLPDIGEVLAQAILDKRTSLGGFINRKQLLEIPGIGESRYEEIRWLLYIDNEQPLPEPTSAAVTPDAPPAETAPLVINLNTAGREDLLRLPGCDEAAAEHILWLRGEIEVFHNPDELLVLSLAGEHTISNINQLYEQWKAFLFVDDNGSKQLP